VTVIQNGGYRKKFMKNTEGMRQGGPGHHARLNMTKKREMRR